MEASFSRSGAPDGEPCCRVARELSQLGFELGDLRAALLSAASRLWRLARISAARCGDLIELGHRPRRRPSRHPPARLGGDPPWRSASASAECKGGLLGVERPDNVLRLRRSAPSRARRSFCKLQHGRRALPVDAQRVRLTSALEVFAFDGDAARRRRRARPLPRAGRLAFGEFAPRRVRKARFGLPSATRRAPATHRRKCGLLGLRHSAACASAHDRWNSRASRAADLVGKVLVAPRLPRLPLQAFHLRCELAERCR